MAGSKLRFHEGDVIAVPLETGGFVPGVIARMDGRGRVLGYFYRLWYESVPSIEEVGPLVAKDAKLVRRFGDYGLLKEGWPVLGPLPGFRRDDWPVPAFVRIPDERNAWLTEYNDALDPIREKHIEISEAYGHPRDIFSGSTALQAWLARLVGKLD